MARASVVLRGLLALVLTLFVFGAPVLAQGAYPTVFPRAILLLDQERLINASALGKAILQTVIDKRRALIQENRMIDQTLEAEEKRLTEKRASLPIPEFQTLAEDFDARVQKIREEQLQKGRALQEDFDRAPLRFMTLAAPYLNRLMQKYSASALLDRRSVLLFDRNMDITDEAISLLDKAYAENPNMAVETDK